MKHFPKLKLFLGVKFILLTLIFLVTPAWPQLDKGIKGSDKKFTLEFCLTTSFSASQEIIGWESISWFRYSFLCPVSFRYQIQENLETELNFRWRYRHQEISGEGGYQNSTFQGLEGVGINLRYQFLKENQRLFGKLNFVPTFLDLGIEVPIHSYEDNGFRHKYLLYLGTLFYKNIDPIAVFANLRFILPLKPEENGNITLLQSGTDAEFGFALAVNDWISLSGEISISYPPPSFNLTNLTPNNGTSSGDSPPEHTISSFSLSMASMVGVSYILNERTSVSCIAGLAYEEGITFFIFSTGIAYTF